MQWRRAASSHSRTQGFTLVELAVVTVVLLIIVAIVTDSMVGYQTRARDSERTVDVEVISRALERYYRTSAVATGATYPSTATNAAGIATIVDNVDATIAPQLTGNSIVISTSNAAQTPTISQYIYQPLNLNGSLCTTTPCVRFKLYYRLDLTKTVVTINSVRQQ